MVLFARRKKNVKRPLPGSSEVLQNSKQRTATKTSNRQISILLPLRGFFRRLCRLFCCLRQPVAALGGSFFRLTAASLPEQHTPCAFRRPRRHPSLLLPQQTSPPFKPLRQPQVRHNHRSFRRALPERPCRPLRSCREPQHGSPARHTAKADPDTAQKCCR